MSGVQAAEAADQQSRLRQARRTEEGKLDRSRAEQIANSKYSKNSEEQRRVFDQIRFRPHTAAASRHHARGRRSGE
jgi:hypothetical protein